MRVLKVTDQNAKLDDSGIISRILQGEKELYELLLRRNNQKLFRVIRSYIRDISEIEDIMQNTYLKAYEKLHQFRHSSEFSTWLIRIGINLALARLKEKGRYQNIDSSADSHTHEIMVQMRGHEKNPEEIVIQKETKFLIEEAIDLLDVKYRTVFIMKEVEGMSIQEISDCLDLSLSNVKVRLHRAKNTMKEELLTLHLKQGIFEFGFSRCDRLVESVMGKI